MCNVVLVYESCNYGHFYRIEVSLSFYVFEVEVEVEVEVEFEVELYCTV